MAWDPTDSNSFTLEAVELVEQILDYRVGVISVFKASEDGERV